MKDEKIPFAISPEQFARDVLREIERGTAGKVWMAGGAWMARIAYWILPEWAIVSCFMHTSVRLRFEDADGSL